MSVAVGLLIGTFVGGVWLLCILLANNSKKWHDKHHTHHSELMCDHCKHRTYHSGYSMSEVLRRWPMRIFSESAPRGEG